MGGSQSLMDRVQEKNIPLGKKWPPVYMLASYTETLDSGCQTLTKSFDVSKFLSINVSIIWWIFFEMIYNIFFAYEMLKSAGF